ncbi:MAG TPA: rod shape-determining protein MreC [Polyangia bacterium]
MLQLPRRARELVIVAILLALPLLFLRASVKSPSELNALDRVVLRISSPVETGLTSSGRWIGDLWHRYVALWNVSDENARLRDENAKLRTELSRFEQAAHHNTELEALLALRKDLSSQTVAARVVGAVVSSQFRVVRIRLDRGELEVKPGMPVLASGGVVGRIERVYGPYSDVLLASDPKSAIDVVVPRTGSRGVLKGIPGSTRYRSRIDYLLRKDEVAAGDQVVTSGIGGFPRDLPVGKIVEVTRRNFGLYQDAEVEPAVELGKLRQVLVVLAPPPPAEKAER